MPGWRSKKKVKKKTSHYNEPRVCAHCLHFFFFWWLPEFFVSSCFCFHFSRYGLWQAGFCCSSCMRCLYTFMYAEAAMVISCQRRAFGIWHHPVYGSTKWFFFFSCSYIVFAVWIDRSFFSYLFCRSSVVFVYVAGVLRENWVTSSSLVVFLFFFCFHSHTKLGLTEFQLFFWCGILCMFQGYLGFFTSGTADGGSENMFFECISNYNIQLVLAFDLTNVLNLNTKMTKNVNFHANKIYRIGIQSDQTYKQSQAIYRQNKQRNSSNVYEACIRSPVIKQ